MSVAGVYLLYSMPADPNNLIYEDVPFERRWMWFERTMWLLLSLLLVASCLGMFGRGAYARHVEQAGVLEVTYDRVVRSWTQAELIVSFDAAATKSGQVRLIVSGALLDRTRILGIVPKPASEEAFRAGTVLTFRVVPGSPASVAISQKVEGIGRVQSHIALENGPTVSMDQLILP